MSSRFFFFLIKSPILWSGWCKCLCALNCLSESEPAAQRYVGNVGGRHFYDCSYAETEGLEVVALSDP